jgi:hypothetical protein
VLDEIDAHLDHSNVLVGQPGTWEKGMTQAKREEIWDKNW